MYQVFISYKKRISLQKSRRNAIHIYITEKIWKELIYHEPAAVVIIIDIIIS